MKYIKILAFSLFFIPSALMAASNEFMVAAQLLAAAKNADIQQVQILVNSGADVNYVDSTGLSLVCTALMNNDLRAAQILQMYGADASKCDQQIKRYKSRTTTNTNTGGLFSGLSSAQSITLAAAGAAVVVGGLFLLTDILDPGNDNNVDYSSDGTRPGGNTGGNTGGATESFAIPYGTAFFDANGKIAYSATKYNENLSAWNPVATNSGLRTRDFNFFRPDLMITENNQSIKNPNSFETAGITLPMQNYLLMMHGYSSFANGYMGQSTFRDANRNPVQLLNSAGGGVPMSVGLITANGMNPVGSAGRGDGIIYAASANADSATTRVDKYLNYNAPVNNVLGAETVTGFDLSNSGTAMNPFVSPNDNAIGKIIAGWEGARVDTNGLGDLYGFIPNGRLGVWRTGGGYAWIAKDAAEQNQIATIEKVAGGDANTVQVGDIITNPANGKKYTVSTAVSASPTNPTITINGVTFDVAPNSTMLVATCTSDTASECDGVSPMAIYGGADGVYYVNYSGQNRPDDMFRIDGMDLISVGTYSPVAVKNYTALDTAVGQANGLRVGDQTSMAAIANASLNPKSRNLDYYKMSDMPSIIALTNGTQYNAFINAINKYYEPDMENVPSGYKSQGDYAHGLFLSYSMANPIIVNPAGEFAVGMADGESPATLDATFENYAPVIYPNLEYNFMTVVAVAHAKKNGTAAANSIQSYGNGTGNEFGPLYLSVWADGTGADATTYQSRKCGIAGLGLNGIDPWCFAAAGPTTEMATASAAGAVAATRGAFSYMSNKQIFMLLALTADGAYLGTNPATGLAWGANSTETATALAAYLQSMYNLPPEYRVNESLSPTEYLNAFKEVYGYGLINLERAMTPGQKVYYYNGMNIVSANGNAYWRAAANTKFRASNAFNPQIASISAPFFDILESADGTMSLPRVWKNEFALGISDKRGLYMGDVLGELKTRRTTPDRVQMGNFGFSMATSQRAYNDNLGGLDMLRFDYHHGDWTMAAGFQQHFTDGASRFDGMANPVLSMASDAIMSDAEYRHGNWSFGAHAFSGAITDEGLLENDPTVTSQYRPARLGLVHGGAIDTGWHNDRFDITTSMGLTHETDTLLGAQTGGLLSLGNGDTTYVDVLARYNATSDITFSARATFARTTAAANGDFILGMTDIESDAFALGANIGNFEFTVSRPLAVRRGSMQYSHADYDVVEMADGKYDLVIGNTYLADVNLNPANRETRVSGTYRHNFGKWTDGAIGFIYRVHPNHTDEFGNESIFMMKLTHRMGI